MQGQQKPSQSKIKNPLLVSSVTGLTYDDYVHNTILLPAAPVFVRKEPEPDIRGPVIFSPNQHPGTTPILEDTENFSEISLEQNAPEPQTISQEYNPLQDIDSEPKQDTILDQATASFAQLPAVASTVFSTFSNIIKGSTSNSPPPSQIQQPQVQPVPVVESQFDNFYSPQSNQYSYQTAEQQPQTPPPPPTFFSPTDPSLLGNTPREAPTSVGGNTYRLGGLKKKTYAHIPGLNTGPTGIIPTSNPIQTNYQQPPISYSQPIPPQPVQEPPQAASKFSLFEYIPKIASLPKIPSFSIDKKKSPDSYWNPPQEPKPSAFVPAYTGASFQPVTTEFYTPIQPSPAATPPSELKPITPTPPRTFTTGLPNQTLSDSGLIQNFDTPKPLSQPSFLPLQTPIEQALPTPPAPTFYTPEQVSSVAPPLHQQVASKNPYSSSKLRKGVGHYKNPLVSPQGVVPTYLPNQLPPTNFFNPAQQTVNQVESVPVFIPLGQAVTKPVVETAQISTNPFANNSNFFAQPVHQTGLEPESAQLSNPIQSQQPTNPGASFYDPSNFFSQPIQPAVSNQDAIRFAPPQIDLKQESLSENRKSIPEADHQQLRPNQTPLQVQPIEVKRESQISEPLKPDPIDFFQQLIESKENSKVVPHVSLIEKTDFFQQTIQPLELNIEKESDPLEFFQQPIVEQQAVLQVDHKAVSVLDPTSFAQQQIESKKEQQPVAQINQQSQIVSTFDPLEFFQQPIQPIEIKKELEASDKTDFFQQKSQSEPTNQHQPDLVLDPLDFFQQPVKKEFESPLPEPIEKENSQPISIIDPLEFFQKPLQPFEVKQEPFVSVLDPKVLFQQSTSQLELETIEPQIDIQPISIEKPIVLKKESVTEQPLVKFYDPSAYFNQNIQQPVETKQPSVPPYDPLVFFNQTAQPPPHCDPSNYFDSQVSETPKVEVNFFNTIQQTAIFEPQTLTETEVSLRGSLSYFNQPVEIGNTPQVLEHSEPVQEQAGNTVIESTQEALQQQLINQEETDKPVGKATDLFSQTNIVQEVLPNFTCSQQQEVSAKIEEVSTLNKLPTLEPSGFQSQEHLLVEQIPSQAQALNEDFDEEDDQIDDLQASQITEQVEFLIGETPLRKSVSEDTPTSKFFPSGPFSSETSTPKHAKNANPEPNLIENFQNLNIRSQQKTASDFFSSASQPQIAPSDSQTFNFCNFFNQPSQPETSFFGPSAPISRTVTDSAFDESIGYVAPDNKSVEPEPLFRSDNLFDFKLNTFSNTSDYSRDVLIDENSIAPTMDTTTASASCVMSTTNVAYRPVYRHWFYNKAPEGKTISIWTPFSMNDSLALEEALLEDKVIHTDGGRYDVKLPERKRTPVYWTDPANEVRRCSWFFKNLDSRFVPYEEAVADLLESEYKESAISGEWHRKVALPNGDTVVFHGPSVMVHFLQTQNPDAWDSTVPQSTNRPRVVKRGVDEFNIEEGEPEQVDHILFMVHGIGEACDIKFRPVVEVVDDFRSIAQQLVQSHYRTATDRGDVGRVEILPISWHNELHSEESGIDKKLKQITLESIPKLRNFTNDTLLDVLFYTSPMFCQSIIDAVGKSLNRLHALFCQRNPNFHGGVSLAGHSLGSLIIFDILCHQKKQSTDLENSENPDAPSPLISRIQRQFNRRCSQQQINYEVGSAGTGQPYITYPQLNFQPTKFFALGSPIGMFVTIRGIDTLGLDFELPTCSGFYNLFHPYDPVAYRVEALVNPELANVKPVLIPHHKGRKRMHLELKETMLRVSTDIKQKFMDTFKTTIEAVMSITAASRPDHRAIEKEVDKVLESQMKFETGSNVSSNDLECGVETDVPLGQLNRSKRIDYVLQEAPLEFINEYIFALTSHVGYWDSEDTILFIMKEIYTHLNMQADSQLPLQTMTIERPLSASPSLPTFSLLRQKESPDSKKTRKQ